jgi:hypothetical protein
MTQGGRELVVGSVIIAAVLVLAAGTLWLKGTEFGQEETYVEVLVREVGQRCAACPSAPSRRSR